METKKVLHMGDDETLCWEYEGKKYLAHIQLDDIADSPRSWDPITTMACFHSRYNLGDKLDDKTQEEFWQRLVRENVPEKKIYEAAAAGKLTGIRLAASKEYPDPDMVDVYETYHLRTILGTSDAEEVLEYEGIAKDAVADYLYDDLTVQHCMILMEPYAEWLPLWLYDHSGITMSCGARTGQYADAWDSGCVGWIIAMKDTIMKECPVEYVLDENGERIKVEHDNGNGTATYNYMTRPLTEDTWRKRAIEIMKDDVDIYDKYITNDVYGYTLYADESSEGEDKPDWTEEDSCWGFYGSNIFESGLADNLPGFEEAFDAGTHKTGRAEKVVRYSYNFS